MTGSFCARYTESAFRAGCAPCAWFSASSGTLCHLQAAVKLKLISLCLVFTGTLRLSVAAHSVHSDPSPLTRSCARLAQGCPSCLAEPQMEVLKRVYTLDGRAGSPLDYCVVSEAGRSKESRLLQKQIHHRSPPPHIFPSAPANRARCFSFTAWRLSAGGSVLLPVRAVAWMMAAGSGLRVRLPLRRHGRLGRERARVCVFYSLHGSGATGLHLITPLRQQPSCPSSRSTASFLSARNDASDFLESEVANAGRASESQCNKRD